MTQLLDFAKATLLGGVLVVLPIVGLFLLLAETVSLVLGLVAPIAELLPIESLGGITAAYALAILLVIGICFAAGLLANLAIGARLIGALERRVLERIPGYTLIRSLSRQLAGRAGPEDSMFSPAVLSLPLDGRQLVYLIEEHDDGYCTVMLPTAPTATAGPVQHVPRERVTRIEASLGTVMACLQSGGVGSGKLIAPSPD